jgi:hypothetical protein
VSATDIMKELPRLKPEERRALLEKLRQLENAQPSHLSDETTAYGVVDLRSRGISEAQAANLRTRLKTFAQDWDRPEMSVYDEDPAR